MAGCIVQWQKAAVCDDFVIVGVCVVSNKVYVAGTFQSWGGHLLQPSHTADWLMAQTGGDVLLYKAFCHWQVIRQLMLCRRKSLTEHFSGFETDFFLKTVVYFETMPSWSEGCECDG